MRGVVKKICKKSDKNAFLKPIFNGLTQLTKIVGFVNLRSLRTIRTIGCSRFTSQRRIRENPQMRLAVGMPAMQCQRQKRTRTLAGMKSFTVQKTEDAPVHFSGIPPALLLRVLNYLTQIRILIDKIKYFFYDI